MAEYSSGSEKLEVAVKTMRQEATRDARLKFMKEARLMRRYEHKHVVRILGVAVHEHPLMIVMENCPGLFFAQSYWHQKSNSLLCPYISLRRESSYHRTGILYSF
ncbi:unnamed protein product [Gongylonema pulchrum]|uniref:Protein kinase domain-containing protein n=1 Tax=Gongylonema pulchrum TaxID=637853 RepID=A0A3P6SA38_9BILA|nr:unnamed protein product [Gongylonema pulchrum]